MLLHAPIFHFAFVSDSSPAMFLFSWMDIRMKRTAIACIAIGQLILLETTLSAQTISNNRDKAGNLTNRGTAAAFAVQPTTNNEQGIRNTPPASQNIVPSAGGMSRIQNQRK